MVDDLPGISLLHHDTPVHKHHLIRHIPGKGHLVSDDEHGGILLRQGADHLQHLAGELRVQEMCIRDSSMDVLLGWFTPGSYPQRIVVLLIGCLILGFGVFMEVAANVVMLPGEATSNAIRQKAGKEFGTVKVCVDVSMCIIAIVISLILFRSVKGIREGTIVAALLVGFISRLFNRFLGTSTQKLFQVHLRNYQSVPQEQTSEG